MKTNLFEHCEDFKKIYNELRKKVVCVKFLAFNIKPDDFPRRSPQSWIIPYLCHWEERKENMK